MVWLPTLSVLVVKVAAPPVNASVARVWAPSANLTVPVGTPVAAPPAWTPAVSETGVPR